MQTQIDPYDGTPMIPTYPSEPTVSRTEWLLQVDSEPDGFYAPFFSQLAEIQAAIDLNYEDSMWGADCKDQAMAMRARLLPLLDELVNVGRRLDRRAYGW